MGKNYSIELPKIKVRLNIKTFITVFMCIIFTSCSKEKKYVEIFIHFSKKKDINKIVGRNSYSNKVIKIIREKYPELEVIKSTEGRDISILLEVNKSSKFLDYEDRIRKDLKRVLRADSKVYLLGETNTEYFRKEILPNFKYE